MDYRLNNINKNKYKMKQSTYTVQIIQPSEGHVLTQSADIELSDRIFSEKIFLGINDKIENWKEITI